MELLSFIINLQFTFYMKLPTSSLKCLLGLPRWAVVKNPPAKQETLVPSIPGSEISPGEGNGNPLQDSGLNNFMDRGALSQKSWTQLSD